MRKSAKVGVAWSPGLGLSFVKDVHSFILYSIFSELRLYPRSFLSQDDHTEVVVKPQPTAVVLGSIDATSGLKPKWRFTCDSGSAVHLSSCELIF